MRTRKKVLLGCATVQWLLLLLAGVVFLLSDGGEGRGLVLLQGLLAVAITGSAALTVREDRRRSSGRG